MKKLLQTDDYIAFIDAGETGKTKKESIADLVAAIAGAGFLLDGVQLSVQGNRLLSQRWCLV